MKKMSDNELDLLFAESAKRHQAVSKINHNVMRSIKRDIRHKTLRKWAEIIAFCFGTPLLVVAYIFVLKNVELTLPQPILIAVYVLPVITILIMATKKMQSINL